MCAFACTYISMYADLCVCMHMRACMHVCTRDQCSLYHPPPRARLLLPPPSRTHCLSLTHSVCLYPPAAVCADARTLTLLTPVPLLSVLANSRAHCILIVSGMCVCACVCVCVCAHTHTHALVCVSVCVPARFTEPPSHARTLKRTRDVCEGIPGEMA